MATAPTPAEFIAAYPEFTGASEALIQEKLDDAALRTGVVAWGDRWAMGVKLRAADLLAKSPHGRKLRLVNSDGTTAYTEDLRTLVRMVALGARVL